jgi:hypothetical protein
MHQTVICQSGGNPDQGSGGFLWQYPVNFLGIGTGLFCKNSVYPLMLKLSFSMLVCPET